MQMLKPLHDNVLVEPEESRETTEGGIYLPDTAKERPAKGKVLAVGPGRLSKDGQRVAVAVKVGERVIFSKYGGTEIKSGDKRLIIIREEDLYAVEEAAEKAPPADKKKRAPAGKSKRPAGKSKR